jgi:hypothetical protein
MVFDGRSDASSSASRQNVQAEPDEAIASQGRVNGSMTADSRDSSLESTIRLLVFVSNDHTETSARSSDRKYTEKASNPTPIAADLSV